MPAPHTLETFKLLEGDAKDGVTFLCPEEDYNKKEIRCVCPIHGEFIVKRKDILCRYLYCAKCGNQRSGNDKKCSIDEVMLRCKQVHDDMYDYDWTNYKTFHTKIPITCKKCGRSFMQDMSHHINMHQGCPHCRHSILELNIHDWLSFQGINFIPQYRCNWLGRMSLDFYLPDYNIGIECQGFQHFRATKMFGGIGQFKKVQERDIRKKKLCDEHGLTIYYITYKDDLNEATKKLAEVLNITIQPYIFRHKLKQHFLNNYSNNLIKS